MNKDNKNILPEDSDASKQRPEMSAGDTEPGEANPGFPEEYEEQRSTDLRMKPQPFVKTKKKED